MKYDSQKQAALRGRVDGQRQRDSLKDEMRFDFEFHNKACWYAYVTGFYRGCGYPGSGNRSVRKNFPRTPF